MGNWENRDKKLQKRRDTKKSARAFQKQKESSSEIAQRQKRQEVLHKRQQQEVNADELDMEA